MCNITYPKFPCRICGKNASDKDKAVQCELCELWVHIKCNNLNNATPENSNDPEKVCSSKYYDIEEMHNIQIADKNKSFFPVSYQCMFS